MKGTVNSSTGGPLFRVSNNQSYLDSPMEIIQASALAEYRTSIHNEETWYNYSLILSAFFDDLGLGRDTVRPLKERLAVLETKTERKKYDARSKDLKEIREVKNKFLDIQADIFVTKVRKDLQWGFEAIKSWVVREQAKADAKKKSTNTVRGYIRPIKGLCDANELPFTSAQWKKIYSKFGKAPKTSLLVRQDEQRHLDDLSGWDGSALLL